LALNFVRGAVGAAVIDDDDLEGGEAAGERGFGLGDGAADDRGFVEGGEDEADAEGCVHARPVVGLGAGTVATTAVGVNTVWGKARGRPSPGFRVAPRKSHLSGGDRLRTNRSSVLLFPRLHHQEGEL